MDRERWDMNVRMKREVKGKDKRRKEEKRKLKERKKFGSGKRIVNLWLRYYEGEWARSREVVRRDKNVNNE